VSQRGQPGTDRGAVRQLLAQLERQAAQQVFGFVDQVLSAGEDRAALVVAQGEQLVVLVGSAVFSGALECLGQQRVRQCLARDPLGVELVRFPALTRPVRPRRAIGADITHVIAAGDQEDRGMTPPA